MTIDTPLAESLCKDPPISIQCAADQLASGRQQRSINPNDDPRMVCDANHIEKGSN